MQRLAIDRVELQLFNDSFGLGVTYGEVNDLSFRAVDQFANVSSCYGESSVDATTIDVARNEFLCAESLLAAFLPYSLRGVPTNANSFIVKLKFSNGLLAAPQH